MSSRALVLSSRDIGEHFRTPDFIDVVTEAYRALARGDAQLSPKYHWTFTAGRSAAFASTVPAWGMMAVKVATVRPSNPQIGLPAGISQVLLQRSDSGEPLALLDGKSITMLRTAAAAAVGAIALARPESKAIALIGPGVVGKASLDAIASAFPIRVAYVAGVDLSESARFVEGHRAEYPFELIGVGPEDAARQADIIVTVTPSTSPIVRSDWVRDGTHISAMGADWAGKQELETALVLRSRFVTDSRLQCLEIGEGNVPHSEGRFASDDIHAELGEILVGAATARKSPTEVTVFDSSGIAIQDLAAARLVYTKAVEAGIGVLVDL